VSINQSVEGSVTVLRVDSESLVKDEALLLKKTAISVIDSGTANLKLDLSRTKFIDSSGIGKLLFLNKKINQLNGTFEISAINKQLWDFLDSLALTKVMKVAPPK